jgi:LysM repeat protein
MKHLFSSILIFSSFFSFALVPDSIGVKTTGDKNFIIHKISAKETWYGIAKQYGVSIDELKKTNTPTSELNAGEEILIPRSMVSKKEVVLMADTIKEPIYYDVKKKETLYSISKTFSTIPDSLKKWNNISGKKVKSGQRIIVGYKITIVEPPKPDTVAKEVKIAPIPVPKVKPAIEKKSVAVKRRPVSEQGVASWIGGDDDTTSKMFFALHRTAPQGTIIKVTNKMNRKYVFVKVLGTLPDTGDNYDLIIKLSKSSAEKLGVRDKRFQCELNYSVEEPVSAGKED